MIFGNRWKSIADKDVPKWIEQKADRRLKKKRSVQNELFHFKGTNFQYKVKAKGDGQAYCTYVYKKRRSNK